MRVLGFPSWAVQEALHLCCLGALAVVAVSSGSLCLFQGCCAEGVEMLEWVPSHEGVPSAPRGEPGGPFMAMEAAPKDSILLPALPLLWGPMHGGKRLLQEAQDACEECGLGAGCGVLVPPFSHCLSPLVVYTFASWRGLQRSGTSRNAQEWRRLRSLRRRVADKNLRTSSRGVAPEPNGVLAHRLPGGHKTAQPAKRSGAAGDKGAAKTWAEEYARGGPLGGVWSKMRTWPGSSCAFDHCTRTVPVGRMALPVGRISVPLSYRPEPIAEWELLARSSHLRRWLQVTMATPARAAQAPRLPWRARTSFRI